MAALILNHQFPELGVVNIPLFTESGPLYKALDRRKRSYTTTLERLDHLGELRTVLHGGHHSRYEFLCLQLYFINFIKLHAKAVGLSSQVTLPSGPRVSSCEELLKVWAICSENGCLCGTRETERFLFQEFLLRDQFREKFLELMADVEVKTRAEEILKEEDLSNFHRLVGWIFLKKEIDKGGSDQDLAALQRGLEIYKYLLVPVDSASALKQAQEYFRSIRKIAYLYLDLARLPVHARFHSVILMQELKTNPNLFLRDRDSQHQRLLNSLFEMLLESIYASINANAYKIERLGGLHKYLEEDIAKRGIGYRAGSANKLLIWLSQIKGTPICGFDGRHEKWKHIARIRFPCDAYLPIKAPKIFTEQSEFTRRVKSDRWSMFITAYRNTTWPGALVDVYENLEVPPANEGLLIKALTDQVFDYVAGYIKIFDAADWIADEQLNDIFLTGIHRFIRPGLRLRVVESTSQHGMGYKAAYLAGSTDRTKWSRNIAWDIKDSRFSSSRRWESNCLRKIIRDAPAGMILANNCSLVLEDTNNASIAEIDGAFLRIHGSKLELTIIEAKETESAVSCAKQLIGTLRKMGATEDDAKNLVQKGKRCAYAAISIKMGREWHKSQLWDTAAWSDGTLK